MRIHLLILIAFLSALGLHAQPVSIGDAMFTGAGMSDAVSGGAFTGAARNSIYTVLIDGTGSPDTIKWKKDTGSFVTGVPIPPATCGTGHTDPCPILLSNGVTITFAARTGHTTGDQWEITVTMSGSSGTASFWNTGQGAVQRSIQDVLRDHVQIRDYGVKADLRAKLDFSITSGSDVVTSKSIHVTTKDIGKYCSIQVPGVGNFSALVTSVINSTSFHVATTAPASGTALYGFVATDDAPAAQKLVDSIIAKGNVNLVQLSAGVTIELPAGSMYWRSAVSTCPTGCLDAPAGVPQGTANVGIWWKGSNRGASVIFSDQNVDTIQLYTWATSSGVENIYIANSGGGACIRVRGNGAKLFDNWTIGTWSVILETIATTGPIDTIDTSSVVLDGNQCDSGGGPGPNCIWITHTSGTSVASPNNISISNQKIYSGSAGIQADRCIQCQISNLQVEHINLFALSVSNADQFNLTTATITGNAAQTATTRGVIIDASSNFNISDVTASLFPDESLYVNNSTNGHVSGWQSRSNVQHSGVSFPYDMFFSQSSVEVSGGSIDKGTGNATRAVKGIGDVGGDYNIHDQTVIGGYTGTVYEFLHGTGNLDRVTLHDDRLIGVNTGGAAPTVIISDVIDGLSVTGMIVRHSTPPTSWLSYIAGPDNVSAIGNIIDGVVEAVNSTVFNKMSVGTSAHLTTSSSIPTTLTKNLTLGANTAIIWEEGAGSGLSGPVMQRDQDGAWLFNREIRMRPDAGYGHVALYGCSDTFVSPDPTRRCFATDIPSDTANRFTIDHNGLLVWGPGYSIGGIGDGADLQLGRIAPSVLRLELPSGPVGGTLVVSGALAVGANMTGAAAGSYFHVRGGADHNFELATAGTAIALNNVNDAGTAYIPLTVNASAFSFGPGAAIFAGGLTTPGPYGCAGAVATSLCFASLVTGDTYYRNQRYADGKEYWGDGVTNSGDTVLYRLSAGLLETAGNFSALGTFKAGNTITSTGAGYTAALFLANTGTSGRNWGIYSGDNTTRLLGTGNLAIYDGTAGAVRAVFDPSGRFIVNALTDLHAGEKFQVNGAAYINGDVTGTGSYNCLAATSTTGCLGMFATGDTNLRLQIYADGKHLWGSGAASADTNLYRLSAGNLKTDQNFSAGGTIASASTLSSTGAGLLSAVLLANSGTSGRAYGIYSSDNSVALFGTGNLVTYDGTAGAVRSVYDSTGRFIINALADLHTGEKFQVNGSGYVANDFTINGTCKGCFRLGHIADPNTHVTGALGDIWFTDAFGSLDSVYWLKGNDTVAFDDTTGWVARDMFEKIIGRGSGGTLQIDAGLVVSPSSTSIPNGSLFTSNYAMINGALHTSGAGLDVHGPVYLDDNIDVIGNLKFPSLTASLPLKLNSTRQVVAAAINLASTTEVSGYLALSHLVSSAFGTAAGYLDATSSIQGQLGNRYTKAEIDAMFAALGTGPFVTQADYDLHTHPYLNGGTGFACTADLTTGACSGTTSSGTANTGVHP